MAPPFCIACLNVVRKTSRSKPLRNVDRRAVGAGFGLAVRGEVLQRGNDVLLVFESGISLKTLNRRDSHAGDQVRIFSVGFLDAAPAGFAGDVHHRRQCLVRAADARFLGRHLEKPADQFGIECGAQADRLGKAGAVDGRVTVQAFFVKNHGDSEAAVFDEKFLDGVGQFGHSLWHSCLLRRRSAVRPGRVPGAA